MKKKVLIVDDDAHVLNYLRRMLSTLKYEVAEAVNAEEALRMNPQSFDLVISDMWLSEKSGFWLLAKIREGGGGVKFILMSGENEPGGLANIDKYEKARFIQKPFKIEQLLHAIER